MHMQACKTDVKPYMMMMMMMMILVIIIARKFPGYRNTGELTIILLIGFIRRGHCLSAITTKLNYSSQTARQFF